MGGVQSSMEAPSNGNNGHGSNRLSQRYTDDRSRIVVDIRSANLSDNYNIFVKKQPQKDVEQSVRSVTNTFQSLGGVIITLLTIQKLWEEVRFVRSLRRELAGLEAVMSAAQGQPNGGGSRRGGSSKAPDLMLELLSASGEASGAVAGTTWARIAGLKEVKMLLQEATVLPLLRPDLFQGIRQPPRGILLFGPAGTGKTMLAKAVATESRATFLPVTGSSILSMWYGQSEQNVKALFEKARQAPSGAVIFIDEVDSLLSRRTDGPHGMPDKRVTNEFLAYIDGIQMGQDNSRITIIAATNNPWTLDEAALSRFSRRIYVPLPDKHTRAALIKKTMAGVTTSLGERDYSTLGERTSKYSGRDLVQVCREASMRPMRELWGDRLLESTDAAEPVQRLAEVAAGSIRNGIPERRVRKELERWKRKHKADWCDIDALMDAADGLLGRKVAVAAPAATAAAAATVADGSEDGAAALQQGIIREDGSSSSSGGSSSNGGRHGCTEPAARGHSPAQQSPRLPPPGVAGCPAVGSSTTPSASPGPDSIGQPSSATAATVAADVHISDQGPVLCEDAAAASADQDEAASGTTALQASPCADVAGEARNGSSTSRSTEAVAQPPSTSADAPPAVAQISTAAGDSAAKPAKPKRGSSSGRKGGAAAAGGGAATETWSIAELQSLSTEKVRPVEMADFEAALKMIMHTEFDLTSKYEEWNQQYGSGVDAKRESMHKYSSMYT